MSVTSKVELLSTNGLPGKVAQVTPEWVRQMARNPQPQELAERVLVSAQHTLTSITWAKRILRGAEDIPIAYLSTHVCQMAVKESHADTRDEAHEALTDLYDQMASAVQALQLVLLPATRRGH